MNICLISALFILAPLFSSTPVIPVFVQLPLSQKGYSDSPRPSPFQGVRMTEAASQALLLKKIEPEYPREAEAKGVEGDVVFRIIIGTDGRVEEVHLRRGKPILIEAAAKAVSQWQYQPYILNGNAVEVETFATVRFRQRQTSVNCHARSSPPRARLLARSLRSTLINPSHAQRMSLEPAYVDGKTHVIALELA